MSCHPWSAAPERPFLLSSGEGRFVVDPVPCGSPSSRCAKAERRSGSLHSGDRAARPAFGSARPPVDVRCFRCFVVRRRVGNKIPEFLRESWAFLGVSPQFSRESCGLFSRALLGLYEKSRRGGDFLPDAVRWARVCLSSSPPSRCHFRVGRRHFPAGTARPVPAARQKGWGSRQMRFSPSIDYKKRRLIT